MDNSKSVAGNIYKMSLEHLVVPEKVRKCTKKQNQKQTKTNIVGVCQRDAGAN